MKTKTQYAIWACTPDGQALYCLGSRDTENEAILWLQQEQEKYPTQTYLIRTSMTTDVIFPGKTQGKREYWLVQLDNEFPSHICASASDAREVYQAQSTYRNRAMSDFTVIHVKEQ